MTVSELFDLITAEEYLHVGTREVSYRIRRVGRRTVHILYQWSHGVEDWLSNFDLAPCRARFAEASCLVHRGFYHAYCTVRERVLSALCDRAISRIIIGGYSHGAALAALTAADIDALCRKRQIETVAVGFGSPRVLWDGAARERLFSRVAVLRCGQDIVTHLPPVLLGYRHAGRVRVLPEPKRHTPWDAHREESYRAALVASPLGTASVFSLI